MAENKPRVERPEPVVVPPTKLWVPHGDGELAFVHPSQGPHNYQTVGKGILARSLSVPTGYQTASLVHGAYDSQEPEFQEVQGIMRNNWLWAFNRNLWTPEGVYVAHDPEVIGTSQALNQDDLERKLKSGREVNGIRFSEDMAVRFAPKESYKLGDHTPESLAKDGFIVASFGQEGAEKLGEVSSKLKYNPRTWGLDLEKGAETRVSALDSDWIVVHRLGVGGYYHGDGRGGYAFGV